MNKCLSGSEIYIAMLYYVYCTRGYSEIGRNFLLGAQAELGVVYNCVSYAGPLKVFNFHYLLGEASAASFGFVCKLFNLI